MKKFKCPRCGKKSISINKENDFAKVICKNCKIQTEIKTPDVFDESEIYTKFLDLYYGEILKTSYQ